MTTTLDIFPCTIENQSTGETLVSTRARLTDNWLSVWAENPIWPHDPLLVVNSQIDEPPITNTMTANTPVRRQRLVLMTIDRVVYEIKRQGGCGCGSRLKTARLTADQTMPPVPWPTSTRTGTGRQLTDIEAVLQSHFPEMASS